VQENGVSETNAYTAENVREALSRMSKLFRKQTERFIVDSDFELKDGTVTLKLMNQTLLDLFNELKQEIVDFIRKDLKNGQIQLTAILTAEIKEAKPRTEQEKYNLMAEKNPILKKMREDLGLDLVF
jgi:DNA polymerase-3 subunit gamma/tau